MLPHPSRLLLPDGGASIKINNSFVGFMMVGLTKKVKLNRKLIQRYMKYGPEEEDSNHAALKCWLAKHLNILEIRDIESVKIERLFISGDMADIVVKHHDGKWSIVEIELLNPLVGAYQAIKYRALLCAEQHLPMNTGDVRAYLVAWPITKELSEFCRRYGVKGCNASYRDGKLTYSPLPE